MDGRPRVPRSGAVAAAIVLISCTGHRTASQLTFTVVPATPSYLLRYPDAHQVSFAETLRAYNGYQAGAGAMDLLPGMQVRVENAYYLPGMPRHGLEGFLGTEVALYRVSSHGALDLLSVRPMTNRPANDLSVQQLISPAEQHARYHRFYNEIFFRTTERRSGATVRGSVLLSTNSSTQLRQLAAQLAAADPASVCHPGAAACAVFPEACSVSVSISVSVNGQIETIPWSARLSSLVPEGITTISLLRLYHGKLSPIRFDTNDQSALELPLLPGDHIQFARNDR